MKRLFILRPRLSHDEASLIARLALHSTIPARQLEELRYLLRRHSPARVLGALHQASADYAAAGGPDLPRTNADLDSYLGLLNGLQALTREYTYLPLAA
ncbi:hypothetical protein Q5H93_24090 [Hymenobacter sp. ASUV-10]|uniref:Uncharacterized protein n=1 Tax=Hymenobacter aranciens TaxID=3063996 RepID=A0ABT9BJI3_9BACT|nr:hypothetical protein [Hymenobacter sp. ASUV-10]MDO7877839.1 hypothetical protein [Hymenobacter sp. ASUV-10]